jgi:UDP-N-acetylglucosamine--N-acetylmuramyl-(pentapeptide) pyrophosphoryl-undecaprenol N-acetylglucosamine transferase
MAVAHPEMAEFFAVRRRRGSRVEVTGLPVRADVVSCSREAGAAAFGFDPGRMTVVALGGSLGSQHVNEAFAGATKRLLQEERFCDLQVLHVTGRRFFERARPAESGGRVRLLPYLEPHYAEALAAADLLVARAGASTVAEVTARGLPAVLIPWAQASTGEQALNAEPLARAGAAVVIPDAELSAQRLADVLGELLSDPGRLARMAEVSRSLGRPKAAEAVAKVALELAVGARLAAQGRS